jgi:hypothetical protein
VICVSELLENAGKIRKNTGFAIYIALTYKHPYPVFFEQISAFLKVSAQIAPIKIIPQAGAKRP